MHRCDKCNKHTEDFLRRVNPKGEVGIWWCKQCIQVNKPELWEKIRKEITPIEEAILEEKKEYEELIKANLKKYNDFREEFKKKFPNREMMKVTISKYPSSKVFIKPSELFDTQKEENNEDNKMYTWKLIGHEEESKNSETKETWRKEE